MNNLLLKSLTTVLLALFSLCANAQVEIDGIYYYLNDEAKTAKVDSRPWYEEPYSGEVVIPESVEYEGDAYSVTSIGYEAFWGCSDLTSVTIPEGVTSIGYRAFFMCI